MISTPQTCRTPIISNVRGAWTIFRFLLVSKCIHWTFLGKWKVNYNLKNKDINSITPPSSAVISAVMSVALQFGNPADFAELKFEENWLKGHTQILLTFHLGCQNVAIKLLCCRDERGQARALPTPRTHSEGSGGRGRCRLLEFGHMAKQYTGML